MSLTQQFLVISILPLSFLGLVIYLWRSGLKRRELLHWWTIALLAATVWASSVLRFYGGATIPVTVRFTWGVIGKYAFTVTAVAVLLASLSHLTLSQQYGRFALRLSGILGVGALILDSQIWPYQIPDFAVRGQTIHHFDLWAAIWIASWLLPVLAAWMLTRQVKANFPDSLYRNQIYYWLLALVLFMVGGGLASIQQPGQPGWQEAGLVIVLLAFFVGTISIVHGHLPDLQLALRQLFIRLSGTFLIFGLTWLALSIIVRGVTDLPTNTNPNLVLFLAAALFAGLFTLIYRLINELIRRLFLPGLTGRESALTKFNDTPADLSEPPQLAKMFLRIIQSELGTDDAWIFTGENAPAGKLILRPLANLGNQSPEPVTFDEGSLFITYLRQNQIPLVQYDIDTLSSFDEMATTEKELLANWKRVLYMPLHAGSSLVGMIALGEKLAGDSYDRKDFEQLQLLAPKISSLLVQSQNLTNLRRVNDYVFTQNRMLAYEKQYLHERFNLYAQFIDLISPELRQPFIPIAQQLEHLREALADDQESQHHLDSLSDQIKSVQTNLTNLINISGQLQTREAFCFQPTDLNEVTQQVIRSLQTMSDARRVEVVYESDAALLPVLGDAERLQEAVRHLLHNAIKFNKVGGEVHLDCGVNGDHVFLHLRDTGVGIPNERLETLWEGLSLVSQNGHGRNPGLGLTLTQFIVAAHGGRVEVESDYGSGSTFTMYLPVAFDVS